MIDSGKHENMELAMELAKGTGDPEFIEQVQERIVQVLKMLQMEAIQAEILKVSQATAIDANSIADAINSVLGSFRPLIKPTKEIDWTGKDEPEKVKGEYRVTMMFPYPIHPIHIDIS